VEGSSLFSKVVVEGSSLTKRKDYPVEEVVEVMLSL
jgi:hypothetical protein